MSQKLDCSGLKCPMPIVKISKAIKDVASGDKLEITATDPGFKADLEAWCSKTGNKLTNITETNGSIVATVTKGA